MVDDGYSAEQRTTPVTSVTRNGMGVTALALAIIGLLFGLMTSTGIFALTLGILAVLFGLIGVSRTRMKIGTNRAMPWFGALFGALALALGIWGLTTLFQTTNQFVPDTDQVNRGRQNPPTLPLTPQYPSR